MNFKEEVRFEWCKFYNKYNNKFSTGFYDFVLEDLKLIIEVDGNFHRKDNEMNGMSQEESKFLDDIKEKLAEENGYRIIRIPYDDNNIDIKRDIECSCLSNYICLTKVDWNYCLRKSLKNIYYDICEYKNNNKDISIKELSKIFNKKIGFVERALRIGKNNGWCTYNGNGRGGIWKTKEVIMFDKNMNPMLWCNTNKELVCEAEKIGINLTVNGISASANKKAKEKTHKGYIFRYYRELSEEEKEVLRERFNKNVKNNN